MYYRSPAWGWGVLPLTCFKVMCITTHLFEGDVYYRSPTGEVYCHSLQFDARTGDEKYWARMFAIFFMGFVVFFAFFWYMMGFLPSWFFPGGQGVQTNWNLRVLLLSILSPHEWWEYYLSPLEIISDQFCCFFKHDITASKHHSKGSTPNPAACKPVCLKPTQIEL